jgi:HlyD family secretion protein
LFQIAKDLRQMQIDTSVAEADIGHLHLGQTVNFSVDAFQDREFTGTVEQVRLNPVIQQNVVSYNVIVAVSNDDGVLLPGMTANVRFTVNQKNGVLRAPNAALRFKPAGEDADTDNNYTEILEGDVAEGDKVIVRDVGEKGEKSGSKLKFRMF